MCRPPCCGPPGGQGAGIAAVAIILMTVALAAKIGPIVARVMHLVIEVIRIVALTAATVVALAVLGWLTVTVVRWWLRHRNDQRQTALRPVTAVTWDKIGQADDRAACLACGGSQRVVQAIDDTRYRARACPVCEPARRAG
jgi:hypothetical protein